MSEFSSMDQCKDRGTTLSGELDRQTKAQRIHQRPDSPEPEPSCVSFKSDQSKEWPLWFKNQASPTAETKMKKTEPSGVSFKSDWSDPCLINFKGEQPSAAKRVDQENSEVPIGQSTQQDQTHLDSIFMLLEENIVTFVKNELKKIQKRAGPEVQSSRRFRSEATVSGTGGSSLETGHSQGGACWSQMVDTRSEEVFL
ncbi:hypothetical protein PFLUV_G00260230 [Perca fluviatilis]|uniref:Uncharacterized protein n=1 Tax=Perca fluviatilis TaxID=8168 RepID=A0A6A5EDZ0_PERFL|nr:hypothetical protein PFLUV_G00260230 [Perca fluviatilis]